MNQGQEQFFHYILDRVKEDKVDEAKILLLHNFEKQALGTFTQDDISKFAPKIIALLKPDKVEEVKTVMRQFEKNI